MVKSFSRVFPIDDVTTADRRASSIDISLPLISLITRWKESTVTFKLDIRILRDLIIGCIKLLSIE